MRCRPRCQRANLKLGKFQCLKLCLFEHNCVWANSRRDQSVCKCGGEKIDGAKITMYTLSRGPFLNKVIDTIIYRQNEQAMPLPKNLNHSTWFSAQILQRNVHEYEVKTQT